MNAGFEMDGDKTRSAIAGLTAVGVFLFFGALMALLAAVTLLRPGTLLDQAWQLNPVAYALLFPRRLMFGPMFAVLSFALLCTGFGWFRRRRWGWRLAVIIIAIQVAGDLANLLRGDLLRGAAGFLIASALLFYLLRPGIRSAFFEETIPARGAR